MKFALVTVVLSLLSISGAGAQSPGQIIVNIGVTANCIVGASVSGFNALTWTIGGADPSSINNKESKVSLSDLTLTRNVDLCSESLIKGFLVGDRFPTLTLTQYEGAVAGPAFPYMVVTLSNAIVNGYSVGGSNSMEPAETVSFGYSKMCVQTTCQNPDGSLKQPVSVCYKLSTNITS